jgi:hypothetical protein
MIGDNPRLAGRGIFWAATLAGVAAQFFCIEEEHPFGTEQN